MATIDMSLYTSTQDALDNVSRDTVNGDVFEYPDGWSETLAADVSYATYGSPTNSAPLTHKALGSATITNPGAYRFLANISGIVDGLTFNETSGAMGTLFGQINNSDCRILCRNCSFTQSGAFSVYYSRGRITFVDCEFSGSGRVFRDYHIQCNRCVFRDTQNFINNTHVDYSHCLFLGTAKPKCHSLGLVNCTLVGDGTGTAVWGTEWANVRNCLIKDYATAIDGVGSLSRVSHFNCPTGNNGDGFETDVESLGSDPLPNSASGDYTPADVGNVLTAPADIFGESFGSHYRGAVPPAATAGGGRFDPLGGVIR